MAHKLVVISDVHYDAERLIALLSVINSADRLVFCGDGLGTLTRASGSILVPLVCVRGNNDFNTCVDESATFTVGDVRAIVVHGHRQNARRGVDGVLAAAKSKDCKLAFYGHTHAFYDSAADGVRIINPGALCSGSYAVVTVDGTNIICEQKFV